MAEAMRLITANQPPLTKPPSLKTSPALSSLRLAINVAACDNLPLVVLGPEARPEFEKALTEMFFDSSWQGRFVLVQGTATEMDKLLHLKGKTVPAVAVIQADQFGLSGRILARLEPGENGDKLTSTLAMGAAGFQATARNFRGHLTSGFEAGLFGKPPFRSPINRKVGQGPDTQVRKNSLNRNSKVASKGDKNAIKQCLY